MTKKFTPAEITSYLEGEIRKYQDIAEVCLTPPVSIPGVQAASKALFKAEALQEVVSFFKIGEG